MAVEALECSIHDCWDNLKTVVPAKAGIQVLRPYRRKQTWPPAFAGATGLKVREKIEHLGCVPHAALPTIRTSRTSATPVADFTVACMWSIMFSISAADAVPVLMMKLACLIDTCAPPMV